MLVVMRESEPRGRSGGKRGRVRLRALRRRASSSIAGAVLQFATTGTVVVLLLGFAAVELLRSTGTSEAIRDATRVARLAGDGIVAPNVTAALERGDPRAIARMDRVVRRGVLSDSVVRVKLWDTRGRILYSDEHRLIGSNYPLRSDELAALRRGRVAAEVSDLTRPENRFERAHSKLLEVYLGIRPSGGRPLLFEAYQRFSSISASGQRLWQRFLPALIGALAVLELAQIPLAWSLARRIASDLHDGVVQNLAGVSYALSAAAEQLPSRSPERLAVEEGAREARRTVRELRTLLVEIYPPVLRRSGLEPALADLVTGVGAAGVQPRLDVQAGLELPADVEALLFRTAQEALRNVRRHANASRVDIVLATDDGRAVLVVSDDGVGFDAERVDHQADGHFGLRMMGDLVQDADGRFEVATTRGEGTLVRVEVPLR